ncbi:hypothetical protein ACLB2K_016978 [Fragaria x ananassa]
MLGIVGSVSDVGLFVNLCSVSPFRGVLLPEAAPPPPKLHPRLEPLDPIHASATDSSEHLHPPPPLIATPSTRRSDLAALTFSPYSFFSSYALEVVLEHVKEKCKSFCGLNVCDDDIRKNGALAIVKFVPNIKYLWLRRARIGKQGLITLLQGCKDLELLNVRESCGFDEEDEEIAKLSTSILKFMCERSRAGQEEEGTRSCMDTVLEGDDYCMLEEDEES